MSDYLWLKWGTFKGCDLKSEQSIEALRKYQSFGVNMSAMMQRDTEEQKQALCDLIDFIDGEIQNDWTGEIMTKEEAKRYVREYRTS